MDRIAFANKIHEKEMKKMRRNGCAWILNMYKKQAKKDYQSQIY